MRTARYQAWFRRICGTSDSMAGERKAGELTLLRATRADHGQRHVLDLEPRSRDLRPRGGDLEREQQRLLDDARQGAQAQVQRHNPDVAEAARFLARDLDQAHRDRQLVHGLFCLHKGRARASRYLRRASW